MTFADSPRARAALDATAFFIIVAVFFGDTWHLFDALVAHSPDGVRLIGLDRAIAAIGCAALLVLGASMVRTSVPSTRSVVAMGAVCGLVFFVRSLGSALADPHNIAWLLTGDWAEHFASWETYRNAPWAWPPGRNVDLWYPVGTSVVFSDSMPLLAMPAKLLRDWLPEPTQYVGFVFAANCMLQGIFGALLLRRADASPAATLGGCLLILFAPVFLWRIGHDTLTTQWLLLAALWLYTRSGTTTRVAAILPWCALAGVAALTHPYLPPMVFAFAIADGLRRVYAHERRWRDVATTWAAMLTTVLLAWYLSGAFLLSRSDVPGGIGMGTYSSNVLTFFDPAGYSGLIPAIAGVPAEQWEGAAYLGIGVFGLIGVLLIARAFDRKRAALPTSHLPLIIIAAAATLFAISGVVRVGPYTLTHWVPHVHFLGAFRASGRFIWIATYTLLAFVLWGVARRFPRASPLLFCAALVLQMWDFDAVHLHFAGLRSGYSWPATEKTALDARMDARLEGHRHLTLLPPIACGKNPAPYLPFQLLAARHHATFNSGYLARINEAATRRYCDQLDADIAADRYDADSLYIVSPDLADRIEHVAGMACETIDGFPACTFSATPR